MLKPAITIPHAKEGLLGLLFALFVVILPACARNNVHQPEPPRAPEVSSFTGEITSWIPAIPVFVPQSESSKVDLEWLNDKHTLAALTVGTFKVQITEIGRDIVIGQMLIDGVLCSHAIDGTINLRQPEFEAQAGEYLTKGELEGKIDKNGEISFFMSYYPGSMPFEVNIEFHGK